MKERHGEEGEGRKRKGGKERLNEKDEEKREREENAVGPRYTVVLYPVNS